VNSCMPNFKFTFKQKESWILVSRTNCMNISTKQNKNNIFIYIKDLYFTHANFSITNNIWIIYFYNENIEELKVWKWELEP